MERAFSAVVHILSNRNRLDVATGGDLRLNLTDIEPAIERLASKNHDLIIFCTNMTTVIYLCQDIRCLFVLFRIYFTITIEYKGKNVSCSDFIFLMCFLLVVTEFKKTVFFFFNLGYSQFVLVM